MSTPMKAPSWCQSPGRNAWWATRRNVVFESQERRRLTEVVVRQPRDAGFVEDLDEIETRGGRVDGQHRSGPALPGAISLGAPFGRIEPALQVGWDLAGLDGVIGVDRSLDVALQPVDLLLVEEASHEEGAVVPDAAAERVDRQLRPVDRRDELAGEQILDRVGPGRRLRRVRLRFANASNRRSTIRRSIAGSRVARFISVSTAMASTSSPSAIRRSASTPGSSTAPARPSGLAGPFRDRRRDLFSEGSRMGSGGYQSAPTGQVARGGQPSPEPALLGVGREGPRCWRID